MNLLNKTFRYFQWYLALISNFHMRYKQPPFKADKNVPEHICNMKFSNKKFELIIIPALLNNSELISLLKDISHDFTNPEANNLKQTIK